MNLHKLMYQFKTLVDKKTFTAAAESLFISQPTLTQNIQRLEAALHISLFVRDGKNISLTVYGESLYHHACLLDRSYRQALQEIDSIKRSHRQTLVVECGHAWSHGVLFGLMQNYMQQYPDIRMVIKNSNSEMGQKHVQKGECDLALGAIPPKDKRYSAINYIPVFSTSFALFCSETHPLAGQDNITESQISQCEWIILKHESEEGEFTDPLLCPVPAGRIRFEVFSVSNAIGLARQSHCVLALPQQLEKDALSRGLVRLNTASQFPSFGSGLMFIDDILKHEHKKAFIDTIVAYKPHF